MHLGGNDTLRGNVWNVRILNLRCFNSAYGNGTLGSESAVCCIVLRVFQLQLQYSAACSIDNFFNKIARFRAQWLRQVLRAKCLLIVSFFIWCIQCVNDWLNVRFTPHLTDVPANGNGQILQMILDQYQKKSRFKSNVRIKIMFMNEDGTDAGQHGQNIPENQPINECEEWRIQQNRWQTQFGGFVQPQSTYELDILLPQLQKKKLNLLAHCKMNSLFSLPDKLHVPIDCKSQSA